MPETANREVWPVNREGRNDDIDTRSIRKSCVHHGRRLIHTPPDGRDDLVNDVHEVRVVLEHDVAFFEDAGTFHIDLLGAVDQDVIDGWILEQWFQWTKAENFIENFERQALALAATQRGLEVGYQVLNDRQHLPARVFVALGRHSLQVHATDQVPV